jgi:hypothetical protein
MDVTAAIDQAGNIIRFDRKTWSPMGPADHFWEVTSLRKRTGFDPQELKVAIPVGYMPFAVDLPPYRLGIGHKFPLQGWTNAAGQKAAIRGDRLVVIVGEEDEVSARALPWLKSLSAKVPVTFIAEGKGCSGVKDALRNPSGELLKHVGYQATPYMLRISGDGTITGMWMGFDPERAAALEKEILTKPPAAE